MSAQSDPNSAGGGLELEPGLGLFAVLAISLGAMMGSGVFVLPGIASTQAGELLWLAYVLAGLGVLPAAVSKAELATAMPVSGGSYVYIDRAFGPLASTIFGLGLWVSLLLKSAFALVGFGAYLKVITSAPIEPLSMGLLVGIVALNILGVQKVGKAQSIVVAASLAGLVLLILWAFFGGEWVTQASPDNTGVGGLLGTVALVYISYAGVTKVAAVAEEVRDPTKNLPRGMLLSLLVATLLYSSVTYLMTGQLQLSELSGDLHPVFLLARAVGGPVLGVIAALFAIVTMVSMANAGLLASSRFPFAMARDDLLPEFLRRVHRRYMTPVPAIIATGLLMAIAIVFLDVKVLAKLASAMMIAGFLAENVAVIVLRESNTQWYSPSWKAPFYPGLQLAGVVICLGLLLALGLTGLVALSSITVIGVGVFLWKGRSTKRQGVLGRMGPRKKLLTPVATVPEPEDHLSQQAQVVVPVLGTEASPETVAEMGAALSSGGSTEVLRLLEVPEHTSVAAFDIKNPHIQSLRRRVDGLARERKLAVTFDAFAVHDVGHVVFEVSRKVACEWVLMEWSKPTVGRHMLFHALGWLQGHLECNLALFKDAGIRTFRRILVLCEPGPDDDLVVGTADHLSRVFGAEVLLCRFVPEDASAMTAQGESDYLEQMAALCSVPPETTVVRGKEPAAALANLTAAHDLLLVAAPPPARFVDYFLTPWVDRLTSRASCSVLRLKTPTGVSHIAYARRHHAPAPSGPLSSFVAPGSARARLEVTSKEQLFTKIAEVFSASLGEGAPEAAEIEKALWVREHTQNTSVEHGLALPHATVNSLDRTHMALFTTADPLDYGADSGAPVDVVFATIGPPAERSTHLQILSGVSRLVIAGALLEELRAATAGPELLSALQHAEQALH